MVNKDGGQETVRKLSKRPSINVLVSKKTKWNGEKAHTQIETQPKFGPAVHHPPSFARFCETRISSKNIIKQISLT